MNTESKKAQEYCEKYPVSPELLDRLLDSTVRMAREQREAEQRALEWPRNVNELLASLARAVAAVQARVAVLEAKLGIGAD